ncbi:MAG: hypothetical protein JSS02_04725 [Planctomycetes bacterium]|nr:hypothetical protein [Planctomycetota bacterium]
MTPLLAPALIVYEKSPRWESELKRRFGVHDILIRPCRSAADVLALCRQAPGSVIVADFDVGPADVLRLLESLVRRRARVYPVVIGSAETAELEWPARDLGAVAFLPNRLPGERLAQVCRRILGTPRRSEGMTVS